MLKTAKFIVAISTLLFFCTSVAGGSQITKASCQSEGDYLSSIPPQAVPVYKLLKATETSDADAGRYAADLKITEDHMSYVTDVLLLFSLEENLLGGELVREAPVVDGVNAWLEEREFVGLENLSAHAGVEKAMQANVYGGAYNYFDVGGFVEFLKGQSWRAPQSVQLLVKGEEDRKFSLLSLFGQ